MAFKRNSDGVFVYEHKEGESPIPPELLEKAKSLAADVGSTAIKATAVGTAAGVTASAITSSGAPVAAAAATAVIAAETLKEDRGEQVESTKMEDARGGVRYEKLIGENTPDMQTQPEASAQEVTDPFEAFRQCMQASGMEDVTEVNTTTACLPQAQARQQSQGWERS